ncbi:MAG: hypothetical protein L0Z53_17110, partial [Acidobacteriales bacterium]|nr:hypothetical protein [Terriglobales bacterium]
VLEDRLTPASYVVNWLPDTEPPPPPPPPWKGAPFLRLRDAIALANATPGANSITFAPELQGTMWLTSALPAITGDVSINGGSTITIARDDSPGAMPLFRIFDVSGNLHLSNITVFGGREQFGGGIRV